MRVSGKRKPLTEEMLQDLQSMGDKEFSLKWDTSRQYPIRTRKRLGLKSFKLQHDLRPHQIINQKEYKWCGAGHWELIENFGNHASRYDGLRGHCKTHSNESSRKGKRKEYSTPEGKAKIRIRNNARKNGYVLWEHQDELRAFELYKGRCGYCGTRINYLTVEFDHFVPTSKGGKTVPHNMIPCCVKCNRGVGGKKAKPALKWLCEKFGTSIGQCIYAVIIDKQKIIEWETKERVEIALTQSQT